MVADRTVVLGRRERGVVQCIRSFSTTRCENVSETYFTTCHYTEHYRTVCLNMAKMVTFMFILP